MVAAAREQDVTLYPLQFDFVADPSRYVAFVGGRSAGKTFAGSWKAVVRAQQGGLGIIAAPDFPMLEFGAKRAFLERLRDLRVPHEVNQQKGVVAIPSWKAEVRFATLETESRVRGPNYWWGWVDELDYLADRAVWQALKGAIREGDAPQLFATSTPKGRRLLYEEWVERATGGHRLYRASTRDNPYIDAEGFIAALGYAGRFAAQEIEAEFVAAEGLVYPEWSRERMRAVDCEGWRTVVGVDVGSRNPTAILTARVAGDGRIHVERELYRRNMSSAEIVGAIKAEADRAEPEAIWVDPSAAGYILELERDGYPVRKAVNDVLVGIQRVATALRDGLTVDPSCVNLAAEMEAYAYPEGGRSESDKPVKQFDHAVDALRYLVAGEADDVQPGIW